MCDFCWTFWPKLAFIVSSFQCQPETELVFRRRSDLICGWFKCIQGLEEWRIDSCFLLMVIVALCVGGENNGFQGNKQMRCSVFNIGRASVKWSRCCLSSAFMSSNLAQSEDLFNKMLEQVMVICELWKSDGFYSITLIYHFCCDESTFWCSLTVVMHIHAFVYVSAVLTVFRTVKSDQNLISWYQ